MIIYNTWKKIFLPRSIYRKLKYKHLYNRFVIRNYNRNLKISSLMRGCIVKVHNGKRFIPVIINSIKFNLKYRDIIKTHI
uniref:Ribosomal protein S19 n=1 Tax=Babesia duncani TaxID=323732 RepID=A0A385GNU0_9APIC|nr:ribosomal protein S19 [Babesia duncani]